MYLEFFKLADFPYTIGSDERFFFESEIHAEALANMVYTIQQRKGMVLITGEVGSGKTFLGSMLQGRLGGTAHVGMVKHPVDSSKQLLRATAEAFGAKVGPEEDKLSLVKKLEQFLDKQFRRRKLLALILDEVQDMPDEALEEIRLIWNWERRGQRLLQIVLIGQPELRQRLAEPKWESFRQRIVLSYHLGRLGLDDTAKYILHRRRAVADDGCLLTFTTNALEHIHELTQGVPRMINVLCDNALLTAYARSCHKITHEIVQKAAREMTCWAGDLGPDQAAS